MVHDYVFVGAGPASLMAAGLLAQQQKSQILILEAGQAFLSRGCPGLRAQTCTGCSGEACRVTMGVGGASAGYGNKMCHFPASPKVVELIPEELLPQAADALKEICANEETASKSAEVLSLESSTRKFYVANTLFRREYAHLIGKLVARLNGYVRIQSNFTVQRVIAHASGVFELKANNGDPIWSRNVILATGRSGHQFTRRALSSLGVPLVENSPDIGIRLEAPTEVFSEAFFYQTDPKFKFRHGSLGSSRTFCACKGGAIIPIKYGSAFFADGAFLNSPTGATNVALMVRSSEPPPVEQLEQWCAGINSHGNRSLRIGSFQLSASPEAAVRTVLAALPNWPSETHRLLMQELLQNVVGGKHIKMFSPRPSVSNTVHIYGPSLDLYWPRPELSVGFRTPLQGLSVIGDATGMSRGILQALVSGAGWALAELRGEAAHKLGAPPQSSSTTAAA